MFYEPWFLFNVFSRDEFWLVPRRAVVDPCFRDYQTFLDFAEDPFFREPAAGADVVVDLSNERAHRLASCMYMPEKRSVRKCGLLFWSCECSSWCSLSQLATLNCVLTIACFRFAAERQEVMDYFHTCLTLALSSAHPDTDEPEFIKDWLELEDQDDIAKSLAKTPDMSERMEWTTKRLRCCSGQTLVYVPADDNPPEMWKVPTDETPEKFYPMKPKYAAVQTSTVRLLKF
ncbi:uncharacterized protein LOC113214934 [Frankliniella occidentalis]|uniref:Uncharacterized protein LOC113214934 n=1 Tax=Frankliniella occidentalis TaxID=133901 RepID=A0A9C6XRE7_FRAOC|nr:uncharacterized protein LOC113214934 [Frankliniella occidentalis]